MLVKDTAGIEKARAQARLDAYREMLRGWARLEAQNCQFLLDETTDPTFVPRRIGRAMTHEQLEREVLRLVPEMKFLYGPLSEVKQTKKMVLYGPDGGERWSCIYNTGMLPERSIMARAEKDVLNIEKAGYTRADLPKYEFVPGEGYRWDPTTPPLGFKRVSVPHREVRRGWRTVLLRLIVEGVASPARVEKIFRADNTPEWQQHTGRRHWGRPW